MRLHISLLLIGISAFTSALPAAAEDGLALMREGNALLESALHRAALARYREAQDAGIASPLLDYNIGVASYRLGRYDDAIAAFESAYQDPALAPLAAYNLGLAHRSAGNGSDAKRWFELAAAEGDGTPLETLAHRNAQTSSSEAAPAEVESTRAARHAPRRAAEVNLFVRTGIGNDSNPNRSPEEPYVDLGQPGDPLIEPEPLPTLHTPLNATVEYVIHNEAGDSDFVIGYDVDADFYDEYFANDESTQRLRMGASMLLGETANRRRHFESGVFVTEHYQRNFDPDTGIDRNLGDFDIWQQFSYDSAGLQTDFTHTLGRWEWSLDAHLERREYEEVDLVADYDSDLILVKASADYAFSDAMSLRFAAHSYKRRFDDRPSRDLTGISLSTYPAIDYDYQGVEIGLERRLTSWMDLDFSYMRLDRTDLFEGYADYAQDVASLRIEMHPGRRVSVSLGATSRTYEYPNAFAFNDPAADLKELSDVVADLQVDIAVTKALAILVGLEATDVTSTDTRAEYTRARSLLGISWHY
jgi:tetratricopeptide (TPR) repeat protein